MREASTCGKVGKWSGGTIAGRLCIEAAPERRHVIGGSPLSALRRLCPIAGALRQDQSRGLPEVPAPAGGILFRDVFWCVPCREPTAFRVSGLTFQPTSTRKRLWWSGPLSLLTL